MANYCGKTRTNYFEVNDKKAFKEFVESLLSDGGKVEYMENKDGLTGFCCDGVIYGRKSDKTGLEKYADMKKKMVEKIQGFLRPGYACIITELGWEAFRCLEAVSVVITKKGVKMLNLNELSLATARALLQNQDQNPA